MIPNNNLSVLPFYTSINQQNARKWWLYNRIYPLYAPASTLLPFQIVYSVARVDPLEYFRIYTAKGVLVGDFTQQIIDAGFTVLTRGAFTYAIYPGNAQAFTNLDNGQYYIALKLLNRNYVYSEIFTVVNDIEPYLRIQWWDVENFVMDAGTIIYKYGNNSQFKNTIYLPSDLAKPEYVFEEEGETRDGYFFPTKQISEKRYRFSFLASEFLLDVMRFIRMADFAEIYYHGDTYSLDTFLITPEWESAGDVAVVQAEFDTATVAKKLGVGYIKALRGDYNDDFNNDYDVN